MRIIPAIDIKSGKCVRLLKGDFDEVTEYSSDPTEVGQRFSSLAVNDLHIAVSYTHLTLPTNREV